MLTYNVHVKHMAVPVQTCYMGFLSNLIFKSKITVYPIHYDPSILEDTALFLHPKVWRNDLQETKCFKIKSSNVT